MAEIERKEICKCEKCGNEAEMIVTCTLPDIEVEENSKEKIEKKTPRKIKGTATCSHCGNEADMWIDY